MKLASDGYLIYVHDRNAERGAATVADIRSQEDRLGSYRRTSATSRTSTGSSTR
nr:hypothetical protein [Streptomyces sp. S1D4-11]